MSALNRRELKNLVETISKQVEHFSKAEINCLILDFYEPLRESAGPGRDLQGPNRTRFRSILVNTFGIMDDLLMDRVFRAFDKDNDGLVNVKEWIEGLAIFLRGSLEEKIKYCFHVYDLNDDGFITKDEIMRMLDGSLIKHPTEEDPDEGIKDLVELTLRKMDIDHDGRLSFEDFENSVKDENLLLEAFGTCLPDITRVLEFEQRVFQEHL